MTDRAVSLPPSEVHKPWLARLPWWSCIAFGVAVWLVLGIMLAPLKQEATCRDGWHSPSIGRPGACSWHGGVKRGQNFIPVMIPVFAGVGAGVVLANLMSGAAAKVVPEPKPTPEPSSRPLYVRPAPVRPIAYEPPRQATESEVACPKCGGPMALRVARRGRRRGRKFWGCFGYPRCTGLRNI